MERVVLLAGLAALLSGAGSGQDLTVELPIGETALGDVGMYRVAYASYDGDVIEMPLCWAGHFETVSGISYVPHERMLGRDALFLHSPWRVAAGKVWIDYRLRLPEAAPLTLSFGVAMRPDVAVPGKSDGVTFSSYLVDEDGARELMRLHHAKAEWRDYRFDLSDYAGRTVTVRLQTEPGPANDAGWDYSYFGDAKITAGAASADRGDLVARLTSTRAYRAVAEAGLEGLWNNPENGVVPSNALECENAIEPAGDGWRFSYAGADARLAYDYQPRTGTLDDFTVQVDDGPAFQPALGGGVQAVTGPEPASPIVTARGGAPAEIALSPDGNALRVLWEYPLEREALRVEWTFSIMGKALVVTARSAQSVIGELSLGHDGMTAFRRTVAVPYLLGALSYLPAQNVFTCRYLDWTQSHASQCPQGTATYATKTDGTRNPLFETGYIAVSPDLHEVLPNVPHPPSPYVGLLGPCIMLDVWGHHKGTYQGDAENLRALKDNGVDHLAIISHVWQRYGYDVKLPDHLPANPQFGGDEGMKAFGQAANECGYVWSLHENYIDLYPDAPSYDPSARVLYADGAPSLAWYNAGTGVQSFGLKCNRALDYAKQNSPEIHARFNTNAAYLDVHTCVAPWHQLDHEADQPMAAMALLKVQRQAELFQFERDTHGGPLFGEGHHHFYWAGLCDGVEAQVEGGEDHVPLLDFDLLKLHPQMVNHGMGYYERWFRNGYSLQWGYDAGAVEQVDKYRAQEVAYGHAGFIGSAQTANLQWVAKEHHMMHPVQRLAGAAKPTEICYEIDGQFVSAGVALAVGERRRQRVRYDSGLTVWVNWRPEPWEVEGRVLPEWGFLALGPDTEVAAILQDGRFADYAECPQFIFVDARTSFNMPYLGRRKDIEPRLADFEHLGGERIRLTYEWIVNDRLDDDYRCFVHFTNGQTTSGEAIAFQQDHKLPKPTSQWRPGEVITDGPYEIAAPKWQFDTYDVVIGLYKGLRVPLEGIRASGDRILIGRLELERDGPDVTSIKLGDVRDAANKEQEAQADFTAHMNPEGTWVDFGKVATNGSVKVNKGEHSLTVFPYPRERRFTVALDLGAILGGKSVDQGSVHVRALAAGSQDDLGEVAHRVEKGRIVFEAGLAHAGRYVLEW